MSFGIWTGNYKRTYVNGGTPPLNQTNLNYDQVLMGLVDDELDYSKCINFEQMKQYWFVHNTAYIENFNDYSKWSATIATLSEDTVNARMSGKSLKVLQPNATADWVSAYDYDTALDLTAFRDLSASTTADVIMILFYVSDVAKVQNYSYRLGTDSSNYFYVTYNVTATVTGWNYKAIPKTTFSEVGSPVWTDIQYKSFRWQSTTSAANEYITFQMCMMIRADPDAAGYAGPYQFYNGSAWENKWAVETDLWVLYYDTQLKDIAMVKANSAADVDELHIYCDTISFIAKVHYVCVLDGQCPSITWYNSPLNYLECYITSDSIRIKENVGGVETLYIETFVGDFEIDALAKVTFEKDGQTCRAICTLEMSDSTIETQVVDMVTTIGATEDGCIFLGGHSANSPGIVTDLIISATQGHDLPAPTEDRSNQVVIKAADESATSRTTLEDDDELVITLPPNTKYEVDLNLVVDAASAVEDIKVNWVLTNVTALATKNCIGPGTNTASIYNSDAINIQCKGSTSETTYGAVASGWSYIKETLLVETDEVEGTIQIQWAQNTSGANAITVKKFSDIRARAISIKKMMNRKQY